VCTGVFGKRDIGRIEREFLDVLDFELSITEDDIMAHHDSISLLVPTHRRSHGISSPQVPQLGYTPDSPSSTEASFSPRTPSDEIPMAVDPRPKAEHHHSRHVEVYPVVPVPAHVSQTRHEKRQSHSSSTFRILRSIPFPRPFSHLTSSSSSTSSSGAESQAPQQSSAQQGRCQLLAPFAAQPSAQVYA
jgi:hypothetical protein